MSCEGSVRERSGSTPYFSEVISVTFSSLSSLTASSYQPLPKDSQWQMSTGRSPSMLHMTISTAPVSDAGTTPT